MLKDHLANHGCDHRYILGGIVSTFKQTSWRASIDYILSLDIECGLAFMGAVIINVILLPHFHLSLGETILESATLGFLLMRLLRK
jgi:hypothetical protein